MIPPAQQMIPTMEIRRKNAPRIRHKNLMATSGLLALSKKGAFRVINSRETRGVSFELLKEITESAALAGAEE
jgi:hypothetical protein